MIQDADYNPRYLVNDKEKLDDIIKEDSDLLRELGATLTGMQPGASVYVGANGCGSTFSMDDACWNWLRPLLLELQERRAS